MLQVKITQNESELHRYTHITGKNNTKKMNSTDTAMLQVKKQKKLNSTDTLMLQVKITQNETEFH